MSDLDQLRRALEALPPSVHVEHGSPFTADEVDELARDLGVRFPADFRAFLTTYGHLKVFTDARASLYQDQHIIGSPAELDEYGEVTDLRVAKQRFLDELTSYRSMDEVLAYWPEDASPPDRMVPFSLGVNGYDECYLIDAEGRIVEFNDGPWEVLTDTFQQLVVQDLEKLRKELIEEAGRESLTEAVYAGLVAAFAPTPVLRRNDGLVLHRPDGIEVSIRFGDGREFGGHHPGLFYQWWEPATEESLAGLDGRNAALLSSRGSPMDQRIRFRGQLAVEGARPEESAFVIGHDTGIAAPGGAAPPPIGPDEVADALAETRWSWSPVETSPDGTHAWQASDMPVHARLVFAPDRIDFTTRVEAPPERAAALAAMLNRDFRKAAGDVNLDLEKIATATMDGDAVILRMTVFANSLARPDLLESHLLDLEWLARSAQRHLAGGDAGDAGSADAVDENPDLDTDQMRELAAGDVISPEDLQTMVRRHAEWLAGAANPRVHSWFVAQLSGVVRAVYLGSVPGEGQADFNLKDLSGVDLSGANLEACNGTAAIVTGANFSGANLSWSHLTDQDAQRANFAGANLFCADFSRSDLRGADFRKADCTGTDFEDCDLTDADFTGAKLLSTKFPGARNAPQS